jgi:hypothetical protein
MRAIGSRRFFQYVEDQADALVVTGDIAESHTLASALATMISQRQSS